MIKSGHFVDYAYTAMQTHNRNFWSFYVIDSVNSDWLLQAELMEKSWQTNPERLVQVLMVRVSLRLLYEYVCLMVSYNCLQKKCYGTVLEIFLKKMLAYFLKIESNLAFCSGLVLM